VEELISSWTEEKRDVGLLSMDWSDKVQLEEVCWRDRASGTSLIDASSWWDKVAEGEASASGMAKSTEIAGNQTCKNTKSTESQPNLKVYKSTK
jgi:hypothetical protein